jgi:hypothetical protein
MNRARAHHYVPQVYLREWAEDGRVAVRRRGADHSFVASTSRVAQETDLYTIDTEDGPSDAVEKEISRFEAQLPDMLKTLVGGRMPKRSSADKLRYATLLALQFIRTPDRVEMWTFPNDALTVANGERPVSREVIKTLLEDRAGYAPQPSEIQGAWEFVNYVVMNDEQITRNEYLELQFAGMSRVSEYLVKLNWSMEISRVAPFVVSDQPLSLWVRKPKAFEGVGLEGAGEIRFPLSPHHLLVLRPHGPEQSVFATRARVQQVNQHASATCRHMVITLPAEAEDLDRLVLRPKRPLMKFNEGPLYVEESDGSERAKGEVLHLYRPYDDRDPSEYRDGA